MPKSRGDTYFPVIQATVRGGGRFKFDVRLGGDALWPASLDAEKAATDFSERAAALRALPAGFTPMPLLADRSDPTVCHIAYWLARWPGRRKSWCKWATVAAHVRHVPEIRDYLFTHVGFGVTVLAAVVAGLPIQMAHLPAMDRPVRDVRIRVSRFALLS